MEINPTRLIKFINKMQNNFEKISKYFFLKNATKILKSELNIENSLKKSLFSSKI
jgi:hypothetical protein